MRTAFKVVLGLPWLIAQLYLPVVGSLTGLAVGAGDLASRSRWRASDRLELEKTLAELVPGEVPPEGRAVVLARVEARRSELAAKLPGYGARLARGWINLALAAAALGVIYVWIRRRRIENLRLWLAALNGGGGLAAAAGAALGLVIGRDEAFSLDLVCAAAGIWASGGWVFFGDSLRELAD
jgi:hypothetical protein